MLISILSCSGRHWLRIVFVWFVFWGAVSGLAEVSAESGPASVKVVTDSPQVEKSRLVSVQVRILNLAGLPPSAFDDHETPFSLPR